MGLYNPYSNRSASEASERRNASLNPPKFWDEPSQSLVTAYYNQQTGQYQRQNPAGPDSAVVAPVIAAPVSVAQEKGGGVSLKTGS